MLTITASEYPEHLPLLALRARLEEETVGGETAFQVSSIFNMSLYKYSTDILPFSVRKKLFLFSILFFKTVEVR